MFNALLMNFQLQSTNSDRIINMQYDGIIATLGEVFLKGKNRHSFIDRILQTVRLRLNEFDKLTIKKTHTNITIILNGEDPLPIAAKLNTVFGIHRCQLYTICESNIDAIKDTALAVVNSLDDDCGRVKIIVKRSWKKFPMLSPEIASIVGKHVAANSDVTLDIFNPDLKVKVQIQQEKTYVVSKEIDGPGGLPIGINGSSLLMLSGGLDSPVAGYLMMKRGVAIEGLHFDSPPYTTPRSRQKVFDLGEKLAGYMPNGKFTLHIVPFTALQKAIFASVPESYGMTVMRRMMYRIADKTAQLKGCALLSNGESLGQVASQTPKSMHAINDVTTMPVIRPVACMDKIEIIDIARKIDTYDISIRPYEDCCTVFVPKSPVINPTIERCEQSEKRFEWDELLDECVAGIETITIKAGEPIRIDADTGDEICALL